VYSETRRQEFDYRRHGLVARRGEVGIESEAQNSAEAERWFCPSDGQLGSCEEYFFAASRSRLERKSQNVSCTAVEMKARDLNASMSARMKTFFVNPLPFFASGTPLTAFVSP